MNRNLAVSIIKDMMLRGEDVTPLMMYMLTVAFKFTEPEAKEIIDEAKGSVPTVQNKNISNMLVGALGGGLLGGFSGYGFSGKDSAIQDTLIGTGIGSALGGLLGRAFD